MSEPLKPNSRDDDYGPLFRQFEPPARLSTSQIAARAARKAASSRVVKILCVLRDKGPSTLSEIAQAIRVHDHQISGRFKDMRLRSLIEFTGTRRPNPTTGVAGEVYRATAIGLAYAADNSPVSYPNSRAP